MKLFFMILFISTFCFAQTQKAPKAVEFVDAKKFSGLWYEIARTYNSFEKDCVAASVEYILEEKSEFEVTNRCFHTTMEGELIKYEGSAQSSNNKDINNINTINITYFWIFTKEYSIIYIDKNYSTAIMADKDMKNVWIMNRKPFLEKEKLQNAVSFLDKYMDISKLIYTPQDSQGRYK
ncbi:lipocalin family protein [Poseidonibacter sp.]|uniref:lipocalin family protein n=1 Tax=Poseidonibacter sp. TaxID=2321188 RepID=UPI003C73F281